LNETASINFLLNLLYIIKGPTQAPTANGVNIKIFASF